MFAGLEALKQHRLGDRNDNQLVVNYLFRILILNDVSSAYWLQTLETDETI